MSLPVESATARRPGYRLAVLSQAVCRGSKVWEYSFQAAMDSLETAFLTSGAEAAVAIGGPKQTVTSRMLRMRDVSRSRGPAKENRLPQRPRR